MNVSLKPVLQLCQEAGRKFSQHQCTQLAAALAYYSIFSLAPLLIILLGLVGLIWGGEATRGELQEKIGDLVGAKAAESIQAMIAQSSKPSSNVWASIIGGVTLLFGASGVFGQLKVSLNRIWEAAPAAGGGIMAFLKERFLSFAMILVIGFLLLISLALSAALAVLSGFLENQLHLPVLALQGVSFLLSFGVVTLLFALIFKILPDARVEWRTAVAGAAITALFFTIGKTALGYYLGREGVASTYGAAGSFVVMLMWIYYSAVILFIGAEFTRALETGSRPGRPASQSM